jgi:hypothetical protein
MRTLITVFVAAYFSGTVSAQQSSQPPKPGPEIKKLAVYLGQWSYESEFKPGPLGPGGRTTGAATAEMILRGFHIEWRWKDQDNTVGTQGFEILTYNPLNKNYPSSAYADNGGVLVGAYVLDGNKSSFSGKLALKGNDYLLRATEVFATDLMSFTRKEEISVDGKSWTPCFEARFIKAKSAPKK